MVQPLQSGCHYDRCCTHACRQRQCARGAFEKKRVWTGRLARALKIEQSLSWQQHQCIATLILFEIRFYSMINSLHIDPVDTRALAHTLCSKLRVRATPPYPRSSLRASLSSLAIQIEREDTVPITLSNNPSLSCESAQVSAACDPLQERNPASPVFSLRFAISPQNNSRLSADARSGTRSYEIENSLKLIKSHHYKLSLGWRHNGHGHRSDRSSPGS